MKTQSQISKSKIYGALVLEDIISHQTRKKLKTFSIFASVLFFILFLFTEDNVFKGSSLIFFALFLKLIAMDAFFYSKYKSSMEEKDCPPFMLSEILFFAEEDDVVKGFIFSRLGDKTLRRLGISELEIKEYLIHRTQSKTINKDYLSVEKFIPELLGDESFKRFLLSKSINSEEFSGALKWIIEEENLDIEEERFWSKDHLSRIPGLAKDWAYGETYLLDEIAQDIIESGTSHPETFEMIYSKKVKELERVLSKSHGANAVIVSGEEDDGIDLLHLLSYRIRDGISAITLQHKRIYLIEAETLFEIAGDEREGAKKLFNALIQAKKAGNIIVAISNFISFKEREKNVNEDAVGLVKTFISSPSIHLIFIESASLFDSNVEEFKPILKSAEVVRLDQDEDDLVISMLKKEARRIEKEDGILISFPAILESLKSAKRYFSGYEAKDKARSLLREAVPLVINNGKRLVLKEDIQILSEEKTGIPSLAPRKEEREKLLMLEEILHKRVIGQNEAIKAISSALRRSRAGITNPKRPRGSFLFLGPTGVGKTETAKALAEIVFGDEENMSRIDMSEFQGQGSLSRLIGNSGGAGTLTRILSDKQYGVMLLDEFEKSGTEVHNLFLQILDEGFFTSFSGQKINARENIFIATSNAGSDMIWQIVDKGEDLSSSKDKIINHLIQENIFSPELLNRFDAVVLFKPLGDEELKKVANLMLNSLKNRLEEKSINISVSGEALENLVKKGLDKKFGARAMRRVIEEDLEEQIATAIISGNLKSGETAFFNLKEDSVKLESH